MADIDVAMPEIYLQPGEIHLARSPALLKTVLGSCVGVTFWSPRLEIGALCHGVLPRCPPTVVSPEGHRYVDFAILELVRQLEMFGVRRDALQVKVFGGADVLPVSATHPWRKTVGYQNWHRALEVLFEQQLAVMASDVGGSVGRTIQFHTGSGEVLLRRLSRLSGEDQGAVGP